MHLSSFCECMRVCVTFVEEYASRCHASASGQRFNAVVFQGTLTDAKIDSNTTAEP